MLRAMLVVATAVIVVACQMTTQGESRAGPFPQNYREIAAGHAKATFFDPYSIRDAEIAPPKMGTGPSLHEDGGFYTAWVICIKANAKNRMGAYTGRSVTALSVASGKVVNVWDETKYSNFVCSGVTYEPFPEIDAGTAPRAAPAPAGAIRR